ncbi:alanine--tRNA ligase [Candidatus Woesearchaeota archaeon]|nr:alanine--tRNA ligase [Candidatus Woesearchaeota archaeon]
MDPKTLREKYFTFFESKGHKRIPSASLIPVNDASVLFNTAGMQPLVPYLLGQPHPQGIRLVNIQKCLRTVDFENIGDNTHHTFFQMLGNWSLGDYFKKEAIEWSFEFLTSKQWLGIPLNMLGFTVYRGDDKVPRDDEAVKLWRAAGVPEKRIAYCGKDNFWSAGDTGPCGPSTEMFYWTGDGAAPETFDPDDNRWVEIWNDVFMTYNRQANGELIPLTKKNVDTGMGFERALAVLNHQKSSYETGLFTPIIERLEELAGVSYQQKKREMRIIADHLRSAVFVIGDDNGIAPSNVDRGYILRRLIRRAIRYAKLIGINEPFTADLATIIVKEYGDYYTELKRNQAKVLDELAKEEEKFSQTLEKGLHILEKLTASKSTISAEDAFLLFQSYGFPLEMTQELAAEKNIAVDTVGFHKEFEKHQELSRTAAAGMFKGGLADHSEQTVRLHTATHLLNEALRKVISADIHQRGSNITPERLRFDFNFPRKLTSEEIKKVEDEVNRVIHAQLVVVRKEMTHDQAVKIGAEMEFGVKYPATVSVYFVGDYSKEFCGGPHVNNTQDIGKFKIIKEEASAAGIRRIKAVVE